MIYITGDTHGDFARFAPDAFPKQREMTKEDYVIICGDFGLWSTSPRDQEWLDWLDERPFTTLFVTGNHDNYDLLRTFVVADFRGGAVQYIRPSIIHLMRGQIFTLEGMRFFTMGGASCHDIPDGVLSPDDPDFAAKKRALNQKSGRYRIEHVSWWKEELPSEEEYQTAWSNLEKAGYAVDHIISHCPPESIRLLLEQQGKTGYPKDSLTEFLEQVKTRVSYTSWYFGHYHFEGTFMDKHHALSENILPLRQPFPVGTFLPMFRCLFLGHEWDGCTCKRCNKTRDERHEWDGCVCGHCGKTRDEQHDWDGRRCKRCGREEPVPCQECDGGGVVQDPLCSMSGCGGGMPCPACGGSGVR